MNILILVITILFLIPYVLLISFYKRKWQDIPEVILSADTVLPVFISIVVPARNEEKSIPALLLAIKEQQYPKEYFEVIVVDDFSTDSTRKKVAELGWNNLILVQPENNSFSKKNAIEAGIKLAKGELIVTTDADCIPGVNWLKAIAAFYRQTDAFFIAGPVQFTYTHKLLEIFQVLDFITLQGITGAAVQSKFHMMCNGANLAFKKKAFTEVNGYAGINEIASGDDMLLMHKIWKLSSEKVYFLKSKNAIVKTSPMTDVKSFMMQRKRWASKTFFYKDYRIIAVLLFVFGFNVFMLTLFITAFVYSFIWWYFGISMMLKISIEASFFQKVANFYHEESLLPYFFLLQPAHIFYTVIIGLVSQAGKYKWKGRIIR